MDFKDLASLNKYLETIIQDVAEKEVFDAVSKEIKKSVQTDVYEAYSPTVYERVGASSGGMQSNEVIKKYRINGIGIEIRHERMDKGKNVSEIVESGVGYTWEYSEIAQAEPFPRPFMENTSYRIKNGNIHVNALVKGLRSRYKLKVEIVSMYGG